MTWQYLPIICIITEIMFVADSPKSYLAIGTYPSVWPHQILELQTWAIPPLLRNHKVGNHGVAAWKEVPLTRAPAHVWVLWGDSVFLWKESDWFTHNSRSQQHAKKNAQTHSLIMLRDRISYERTTFLYRGRSRACRLTAADMKLVPVQQAHFAVVALSRCSWR